MEIQVRRTGERRYAMTINRKNLPPYEMGGPGFDPLMPHDLLHLIVERELGLTHGIFGFIAAGGGWSEPGDGKSRREVARSRSRAARRAGKLLREGARDDGPQSERATYFFLYEWLRRSSDPERRKRAAEMAAHSPAVLPDAERRTLSEDEITRICAVMDDLSAQWSSLEVGQSFVVEWPDRK